MSNMSYDILRIGVVDKHNRHANKKGEISASYTSAQQKFHEDLEIAVKEHSQRLQEIVEMASPRLSGWYLAVKRSMDLFVGIVGLILLSPVFFIVAALIKIDSRGAVFFSQKRVGKDGELFMMYKFRTMVANAEKKTGPVWASDNDPRLTFTGRFLRKSKIDEFPQLINLIKGNMTMVGPRPERPFFVSYFSEAIPGYVRRLDVIPGITGLAQLRNGYDHYAVDVIKKLQYDVTYIKNMKLSMDLRLLAKTFTDSLTGKL